MSGKVFTESGLSLSGVTLSGGAADPVIIDSGGNYRFSDLSNGSYTVTPSKTGYTFSPESLNVDVTGAWLRQPPHPQVTTGTESAKFNPVVGTALL
jgi:hypothetical protein